MSMMKKALARKAAKAAAKHTAHGAASKVRRDPVRAVTLLGIGLAVGVLVGWVAGRGPTAPGTAPPGTGT